MVSMRTAILLLIASLACAAEWQPLEVIATAYCPCTICCGVRASGLTADGTDTKTWPYGIAVDPKVIPYETPILIPVGAGYLDHQQPEDRIFYADDTGGIIRRRTRSTGTVHIDLRFRRHSSAREFGIKTIIIWIYR